MRGRGTVVRKIFTYFNIFYIGLCLSLEMDFDAIHACLEMFG